MAGNPRELRNARRKANEADAELEAILALPRRRGSRVRWRNGVIWERYGDDDWRPVEHMNAKGEREPTEPELLATPYSSAHVSSFGFWEV